MTQPIRSSASALFSMLVLLAACGDNGNEPKPSTGPDLAGEWTIVESMSNASLGISCQDMGVLTLASTELGFNGSVEQVGQCDTPAGTVDNSGTGKITDGRTTPTDVTFREPDCRYTGQHYHTPPDSAAGTVTCTASVSGQEFSLTGPWYMVAGADRTPPGVSGAAVVQAEILVPGDTFGITVGAWDDRALAWIGYDLGAPINLRDSVAVSGTAARDTMQLVVQPGWVGSATFTAFARDEIGRLTEVALPTPVMVYDLVTRPLHAIDLLAEAYDGAYDAKRNRWYVPQPSLAQVAVVDLASYTLGTPISLAAVFPAVADAALHVDITPGMDTLVVTSASPTNSTLAFVNLVTGTVTPVNLTYLGDKLTGAGIVLTDHDRLLLAGNRYSQYGWLWPELWSYDLKAGTVRVQTTGLSSPHKLIRSADGKVAAAIGVGFAPQYCAWRYDPVTDTLGVCHALATLSQGEASVDASGNRWLEGDALYDASFTLLSNLNPSSDTPHGALAPDGASAWFSFLHGVKQLQTSDGAAMLAVRVAGAYDNPIRMLPDGHRLVVLNNTGGTTITVVDLP